MTPMKQARWQLWFALALVVLSAGLYAAHFAIFRDAHHVFIYLLGDIAFVPVEVLLVTLILHQLLTRREKRQLLQKMNMVIGAFFTEVGQDLISQLNRFVDEPAGLAERLAGAGEWSAKDFATARRELGNLLGEINISRGELSAVKGLLGEKRHALLRLLENPNLLEHDAFTDLLWALTHLTEELAHRRDLESLPESDLDHLAGDIRRAHGLLLSEWLAYIRHLKDNYPYLFSLAVRTNPFDPSASAVVTN